MRGVWENEIQKRVRLDRHRLARQDHQKDKTIVRGTRVDVRQTGDGLVNMRQAIY